MSSAAIVVVLLALGALFIIPSMTQDSGGEVMDTHGIASGGSRLTPDQLYSLAQQAGFNDVDAITAAAIAISESSGNPNAHNTSEDSRGLWQIHAPVHPEFNGWDLYDPQTNANAAYSVFAGRGHSFEPWTTFTHGLYLAHVQAVQDAVGA